TREHARFSVDLVLIEAKRGQPLLHDLDLACLELGVLAPWRLKWSSAGDAVAEMTDEQHIEIRKVVALEPVVVLGRPESGPVAASRLQERSFVRQLRRTDLAAIGRHEATLYP